MECTEITKQDKLNQIFSAGSQYLQNKAADCMYLLWHDDFIRTARIIYSSYSSRYVEEYAEMAFSDALVALIGKAREGKLFSKNTSAKTIAASIFINLLHEHIRKSRKIVLDENIECVQETPEDNLNEKNEDVFSCLELSLAKLDEHELSIIKQKYTFRKKNGDIAAELNITYDSFNTKLWRLTSKISVMMNECLNHEL